jgi:hypothetical protein
MVVARVYEAEGDMILAVAHTRPATAPSYSLRKGRHPLVWKVKSIIHRTTPAHEREQSCR